MNYKLLNKIVDYIEDNLTSDIDLKLLAKELGLNTFIMERVFSIVSNISIKEYIRKRRLSLAYEEIKDFCDYIWLENLNLRGTFKPTIINYIKENHPELNDLYNKIYTKKDMSYWERLDKKVKEYANKNGFMYVIDEEPFLKNPTGKPIIINYFYHEKIRQLSKNK